MRITIDTDKDTPSSIYLSLTQFARIFAATPTGGEARPDIPDLRRRVDDETADNALAAATFGQPTATPAPFPTIAQLDASRAATVIPPAPAAPPVAEVPPAPAAPVAPPAAIVAHGMQLAGVALDVAGLPWDARIHAATKTKIVNGTWKKKKGLDPAVAAAIEAELRAVMGLPAAVAAAPVAPVPPAPPAAAPVAPVPPVVPVAPVAPLAPPPLTAAQVTTFAQLMALITSYVSAGKWTHPETQAICAAQGIPALPLLASRVDLIPQVAASIAAAVAAKG